MTHNIIEAIKNDHDHIRRTYDAFKNERDPQEKQKYANELIRSISVHSVAEEVVVYPVLESRLGVQTADNSREEHLAVKKALYDLDHMSVTDKNYNLCLERCMKSLYHHMQEEEDTILPQLKTASWDRELSDLASQFHSTKSKVPTHPHPSAPDKPPMETVVGMMQAPIDKMFDYVARQFPSSKA